MKNKVRLMSGIYALLLSLSLCSCSGEIEEIELPQEETTETAHDLPPIEDDGKEYDPKLLYILTFNDPIEYKTTKYIVKMDSYWLPTSEEAKTFARGMFQGTDIIDILDSSESQASSITYYSPLDPDLSYTSTLVQTQDESREDLTFGYIMEKSFKLGEKEYETTDKYIIVDGVIKANNSQSTPRIEADKDSVKPGWDYLVPLSTNNLTHVVSFEDQATLSLTGIRDLEIQLNEAPEKEKSLQKRETKIVS